MMKVISLALALCFLSSFGNAQFNYVLTTSMETYTDLTGSTSINNGEVWDDPEYVIPLPFTFELNGHEINSLAFVGSGSDLGESISLDVIVDVSPFSVDLIDRGIVVGISQSPIGYKVEGNPGSRIFKIEWKNAGSFDEFDELSTTDMFVNFQAWLFEGSNRVEFHYGPSSIFDPDLFYLGETGAIVAIASFDINFGFLIDPNILTGPASDPILTDEESFIDGTPDDGMVYILSVNLPLDLEVTGTDGTCGLPNGSATANATGGIEPYAYAWNTGATTQTITDLETGVYSVTVTDSNSSAVTGSVMISNVEPVSANAGSTDETGSGANDGTATAAPFGGTPPYSFAWSNGSTDQMIFGLAPGVYTVTVTDTEGCSDAQSVTVNAFGCPELILEAALSNISCFGDCNVSIIILDVVNGTAPFIYAWSNGGTESSINDLCAGTYSVTVTDANGCITGDAYEIFQPEELLAHAVSTDETSQGANDGTASASPTGGVEPYEYAWSNGSTQSMITGLIPGSHTVVVTDANFCTDTQTVEVSTFGCPQLTIEEVIFNINCTNLCDAAIQIQNVVNGVAPLSYVWNNGSTTSSIELLCPGGYSVTVTDADGCVASETYLITEENVLHANAGSTDETAQGANDGTAWSVPTGGFPPFTYEWSNGSTDSLITGLAPGSYTITVTESGFFCMDTQTVVVNAFNCTLNINSAVLPISCFGFCDAVIGVEVPGGTGPFTYIWSTGDTTDEAMNLCAGTYSVTVHDIGQNCTGIAGFSINEPELLVVIIDQVINITDSTVAAVSISVSGGIPPYTYAWSGPDGYANTSEDISGMDAGLYTVVVTDANGCTTLLDSVEVRDETVGTSHIPKLDVRVYPNPANDLVHFDVSDVNAYLIQLKGIDGRIVDTWENKKTIDVSQFTPGIYVLHVISVNKQFTARLVIAR